MNKHRKLFPSLNTTNPTTDCSDYRDPTTETSFPDFYAPVPRSPPPPPQPQRHQVSPFLVLSASLLMGFFLLVTYYVVIPKCRFGWCRSRNGNEGRLQQSRSEREADEFYVDENHDRHPIWYITTVGLQQSVINSITICEYKKSDGLIEGTDCSVCRNEFRENERVRLLPKCNHAFHIACIDTWLSSHTNCPLCRAQIVITPSPTTNSDPASDAHEYDYDEEPDVDSGITNDENREVIHAESASILKTVDSSSAWRICVGLEDFGHIVDAGMIHKCDRYRNKDRNNRIITGRVNSSSSLKEKCLHKSPVLMKRSSSCNGRFCCSSRIKRNPSAIFRV